MKGLCQQPYYYQSSRYLGYLFLETTPLEGV